MYFDESINKNGSNPAHKKTNEMCKYIFDNKNLMFSDLMIDIFPRYDLKNTGKLLFKLSNTKTSLVSNTRRLILYMYNDEYSTLTEEEKAEYELFKSMSYEEFESYSSNTKINDESFFGLRNKSISDFRVKKCVDLYISGVPFEDIAKELNITEATLRKNLRENLPKETNLYIKFLIYDNRLTPVNLDDYTKLYNYFSDEYNNLLLNSHKYQQSSFNALKKLYVNILSLLKFEDVKIQEKKLESFDKEKVLLIKNLLLINKIRNSIIQNEHMSDSKKDITIKKYNISLNIKDSI